jgi:hypothetical protein
MSVSPPPQQNQPLAAWAHIVCVKLGLHNLNTTDPWYHICTRTDILSSSGFWTSKRRALSLHMTVYRTLKNVRINIITHTVVHNKYAYQPQWRHQAGASRACALTWKACATAAGGRRIMWAGKCPMKKFRCPGYSINLCATTDQPPNQPHFPQIM